MPGFDAIYRQTVTLFNRVKESETETVWYPTVLKGVHLIIDHSESWNSQGGAVVDNVRLHVRYKVKGAKAYIAGKPYYLPKEYRKLANPESAITFAYGNNEVCDFFMEGDHSDIGAVSDSEYERHGFYNYMNKKYDNVFAITSVSQYNLIPHFEIMAR